MKAKILISLFALPFFSVGVWMLWSISHTVVDAWQMNNWAPVEAHLSRGGYETHRGDDSDTFEAFASYRYTFNGRHYQGSRVSLSSGGDNIGSYQEDTGRALQRAAANNAPITVFVDPAQPANSIVDPDIRWGLLGFKSIFLFVFGGVGLGLLIAAWRAPQEKDTSLPQYQDAPWLVNDDWQTATIRSSSKAAMYGAWIFAALWNLISAPLPFVLYEEVTQKENYLALIGLLFPLVGLGLVVWAVRRTREWTAFGPAPVTLDPFPGSIGGHVGGSIDLNLPFAARNEFTVTLTNLHSYVSGSGKNRSRREKAEWQKKLIAHAETGAKGTRLTFRFDVPAGKQESDTEKDDSYYLWRLNLHAELAGTDIDRDYEIPVYATATRSRFLSSIAVNRSEELQKAADERSVRDVVNLEVTGQGKRMFFPIGRHLGSALGGFLVGAIFAAAGWFLIVEEGQKIFGGVFGGIGSLIALACLYMMCNSLEVLYTNREVRTVRRLLGIPIGRKRMHSNSFERFEKDSSLKTQSGNKHVIYYTVAAVDRQGNKLTLGEGFKGDNEANAAIELFSQEFGLLQAANDAQAEADALSQDNFLA
ncbi:MAG: DUF3592 domain-containing protein [Woeseiaceae bacterium]